MKTALTELLEDLNSMKNSEVLGIAKDAIHECIITATSYLETEKQQIIDSYEKGVKDFANYDPERHGNEIKTGLKHYTSTFETNKETLK